MRKPDELNVLEINFDIILITLKSNRKMWKVYNPIYLIVT